MTRVKELLDFARAVPALNEKTFTQRNLYRRDLKKSRRRRRRRKKMLASTGTAAIITT